MKRLTSLMAMILIVAVSLIGCDTTDPEAIEGCGDLTGEFEAVNFGFASVDDPDVVEDFDEAGAELALELGDGDFVSEFTAPDVDPITRTGTFEVAGDEVVLGDQALLPGTEDVEQRLVCEVNEDGGFTLTGNEIGFDFNDDDIVEEADFEADFEPI